MSHDFLTSLHSTVIDTSETKRTGGDRKKTKKPVENVKSVNAVEAAADDRHRTIGVSMSPKLHERAVERAGMIGLSFSRYVQWCIEAELDGTALEDRFQTKSGG